MKKYLRALYESFGSIRLYHEVLSRWTGSGLAYLIVLATLTSLVLLVQFGIGISQFSKTEFNYIMAQVPEIKIVKGQVKTDIQQPYEIKASDKTVIAIIDTKSSESELGRKKAVILIGKDFVLTKRDNQTSRRVDLNELKDDFVINEMTTRSFLKQLIFVPILFLPFMILGQWMLLMGMSIIAAVLSYVVTAYMPEEYNFETRMRISAIAITPGVLINYTLRGVSSYSLSVWVILALWVVYLYAIILGNRYYIKTKAAD